MYSPAVCVFRDSEDTGYAFRAEPFSIAVVGVAAKRRPRLTEDRQHLKDDEYILELYRKVQTTLAVALAKGHDCIVLGALGCGAYRNPPLHVAQIFQLALQEYAGLFREVIFAITDDHNANQEHNPDGNFQPFFEQLHDKPLRELPASHPVPFQARRCGDLCRFGGACTKPHDEVEPEGAPLCVADTACADWSAAHRKTHAHTKCVVDDVPQCPAGVECKDVDATHRLLRRHPVCPFGAKCSNWQDAEHAARLTHPEPCREGGHCKVLQEAHLERFCHVPMCEDGLECDLYTGDVETQKHGHCWELRHCKTRCTDGTFCALWASPDHLLEFSHPFKPPCHKAPYRCHQMGDREHTAAQSHVCMWGVECKELRDPAKSANHRRLFIHVPREPCMHGAACAAKGDHSLESCLASYAHPGVCDIRKPCNFGDECRDRWDAGHVKEFWHGLDFAPIPCDVTGLNMLAGGTAPIDFPANHANILRGIAGHHGFGSVDALKAGVNKGVLEWVRSVRPVHCCRLVDTRPGRENDRIFARMIAHGHLLSAESLLELSDPATAAKEARGHVLVHKIINASPVCVSSKEVRCAPPFSAAPYAANPSLTHLTATPHTRTLTRVPF